MPKSRPPYPPEFRRRMIELSWSGRDGVAPTTNAATNPRPEVASANPSTKPGQLQAAARAGRREPTRGCSRRAARPCVRLALALAELGPEASSRRVRSSRNVVDRLRRLLARTEPAPSAPDAPNEDLQEPSRGHLTRPVRSRGNAIPSHGRHRMWRRQRCGRRSARRGPRSRDGRPRRVGADCRLRWVSTSRSVRRWCVAQGSPRRGTRFP